MLGAANPATTRSCVVAGLRPGQGARLERRVISTLCRPRAVFGHGIHLTDEEQVVHRYGSAISHCPTSNFFLGSVYFNILPNLTLAV